MRISDWSSDVCSSDLRDVRREARDVRQSRREYREDWRDYRKQNRKLYTRGNWRSPYRYHAFGAGARIQPGYYAQRYVIADPRRYRLPVARGPTRWVRQIGRAACRGRVCQYV